MRRICVRAGVWLACLLVPGGLAGQPPEPTPIFRQGVDRIVVDATIVDRDGVPIQGLTREDFVLEVDGKPRVVQAVDFLAFRGDEANAVTSEALPEVSTNATQRPSRLVLIVVDQETLEPGEALQAREGLSEMVRSLAPSDRIGLVTFGGGPRQDFTRHHERVIAAIDGVQGLSSPIRGVPYVGVAESLAMQTNIPPDITERVVGRECPPVQVPDEFPNWEACARAVVERAREVADEARFRVQRATRDLQNLIAAFARVSGQKSVVFVSRGLPMGGFAASDLHEIGRLAARASIAFYVVQPYRPSVSASTSVSSLGGLDDSRALGDFLGDLASVTGGTFLRPSGQVRGAFERIAREMTGTWQLAFDPLPEEKDGKPHRISLKLARGGARVVRHRLEFVWTATAEAPPRDLSEANRQAAAERLAALVSAGEMRSELPMRVTTFTAPTATAPGQTTTLWTQIDTRTLAVVHFHVVDAKDTRLLAKTHVLRPPDGAEILDHFATLPLPPGRYMARVAAQDDTGRVGILEHPFDTALAGTPELRVGSLLMLDERTVGDGRGTPLHATRGAAVVRAHLELQSRAVDWRKVAATLDMIDPVDGRVRTSQALLVGPASTPDRRVAHTLVPLKGWAPGMYLFKASVMADGVPIATVTRTLVVDALAQEADTEPAPEVTDAAAVELTDTSTRLDDAGLSALLALGTAFVSANVEPIASVVAEEHYVQIARNGRPAPERRNVDAALEWRPDNNRKSTHANDAAVRRQTNADVLTLKTAEGIWTTFRDVRTVDGRQVKDRTKRALSLFEQGSPDAIAKLRRVANESSRHNLGQTGNFNTPMLPLQVLHPAHRARFGFASEGSAVVDGVATHVVSFRELKGPTFIATLARNEGVPVAGRLWLAQVDGRILRAELLVRSTTRRDELGMSSQMLVDYRPIPELDGLLMPVRMWERHTPDLLRRMYYERRATYTNYRRFTVTSAVQ